MMALGSTRTWDSGLEAKRMMDRAGKRLGLPYLRVTKRALQSWANGEPELRLVRRLCSRAEWSVDVGANKGVYAWHLSHCSAGVLAFEPQPLLASFLEQAFGSRIRVEQVALSEEAGEAVLRVPTQEREDGRATIEPRNRLSQFRCDEYTVPCRRLDSYEIGPVGLIKIDVEGHELSVLKGARAIILRDRPNLIIEAEERHRPDALQSVRGFLETFGYRPFCWRNESLSGLDPDVGTAERDCGREGSGVRAEQLHLHCASRRGGGARRRMMRPNRVVRG